MPFLSIVIPTKNEEANLPKLLKAIQAQTFKDYEIIVADNGSTDRTREVSESYGARVVPGGLPGVGRNRGAEAARGQVTLFLDADTGLPHNDFLEKNLQEMKDKGIDVATCRYSPDAGSPAVKLLFWLYDHYVLLMEKIRPYAGGFCIFVKTQVHRAIGGFDESVVFAEDHEYVQRAAKKGFRFRILRARPVVMSTRRMQKQGALAIAWKYIKAESHILFIGHHKTLPKGGYEMGGDVFKDKH